MSVQAQGQASEESLLLRKRKRKTYSCLDCRRRKLKCDRDHPCGRCIKEGHAESCAFRDDGHNSEVEEREVPSRSAPSSNVGESRKHAVSSVERSNGASPFTTDRSIILQKRIDSLESKLAKYETPGLAQHRPDQSSEPQQDRQTTFFKGRSFRTSFYGPTNPGSIFKHSPEIFAVSGENRFRSAALQKVAKDLGAMRNRRKESKKNKPIEAVTDLLSLLPPLETVDYKVELYLETFETTLRIIHRPSFWSEYRAKPPQEWREPFVAVVLMIIAAVNCVAVSELNFEEDISSTRVETQRLVTAVDEWAERQSQKHLTIETFQVRLLSLLAKANTALKRKRAWANSGFLLRIAISAGFHRDPSDLHGSISVYDQEMRRRLWATIVEWDLSVSIHRGIPPMTASIPADCRAPSNINDVDIQQDSQVMPEGKLLQERTDTSFLQISLQSLPLRTTLASLLNDPNTCLSWSDVLSYEEKIQEELQILPEWTRERNTMAAVLLDLQLRQYILWLYGYHGRGQPGPKTAYARLAAVNTASEIIEQYSGLSVADVNALNMLRNDMFQCIVIISLNMLSEAKNATMAWSLINSLQPMCEKAFLFLEDKVLKVGEGYNHMWFASASFAIAQTTFDPKLGEARTIAGERIAKIYYKVLTYQENTQAHPSRNGETDVSWQVTPETASIRTPAAFSNPPRELGETLDFADFSDITGWMNDDFFGYDMSFL